MKIYLAYRFSGVDRKILRQKLEKISQALVKAGHEPFIFCRDIQEWGQKLTDKSDVIKAALPEIKKADAFLIFLDSEEKSEGMLIETGFAKAHNKKIILAIKKGLSKHWLPHLAEKVIEFENLEDLQNKIKETL